MPQVGTGADQEQENGQHRLKRLKSDKASQKSTVYLEIEDGDHFDTLNLTKVRNELSRFTLDDKLQKLGSTESVFLMVGISQIARD